MDRIVQDLPLEAEHGWDCRHSRDRPLQLTDMNGKGWRKEATQTKVVWANSAEAYRDFVRLLPGLRPLENFLRAIAPCFEPSAPEQVHGQRLLAEIGKDRCGVDRTRSLLCQDTCVALLPLHGRGGDLYVCMSKNSINAICVYIYLYICIQLYICRMSLCVPRLVLPLDA